MRKIFLYLIFIVFCFQINAVKDSQKAALKNSTEHKQNIENQDTEHRQEQEAEKNFIEEILAKEYLQRLNPYRLSEIFNAQQIIELGKLISRLIIVVILYIMLWKAANRYTTSFVRSIIKKTYVAGKNSNIESTANTAGPILNSVLHWLLTGITILTVLSEIGIPITPIIYSFGVLGLAISIGSQTIVKDIISGLFTLLEGAVSVGEIVQLNGNAGKIEGMSLRAIEFRHSTGKTQIIPFSEITSLINLSRDYTVCKIIVPVDHEADITKVEETYFDVFSSFKKDRKWEKEIIGDLQIAGVTEITESAVYFYAKVLTKPDPYDAFGQEFRKRLFTKLKETKIIPSKFANLVLKVPD